MALSGVRNSRGSSVARKRGFGQIGPLPPAGAPRLNSPWLPPVRRTACPSPPVIAASPGRLYRACGPGRRRTPGHSRSCRASIAESTSRRLRAFAVTTIERSGPSPHRPPQAAWSESIAVTAEGDQPSRTRRSFPIRGAPLVTRSWIQHWPMPHPGGGLSDDEGPVPARQTDLLVVVMQHPARQADHQGHHECEGQEGKRRRIRREARSSLPLPPPAARATSGIAGAGAVLGEKAQKLDFERTLQPDGTRSAVRGPYARCARPCGAASRHSHPQQHVLT